MSQCELKSKGWVTIYNMGGEVGYDENIFSTHASNIFKNSILSNVKGLKFSLTNLLRNY